MAQINVIKTLKANIKNKTSIKKIDVDTLKKINNYFEVVESNVPNRIFIDLDGKTNNNITETEFNNLDNKIISKLTLLQNVSIMTSSHIKALKKDINDLIITEPKLSYRITFINEYCKNTQIMKEIVFNQKFILLQNLLNDIIKFVKSEESENYLTLDGSVYRNGKIRCVNAYKIPEQKERINKLIKGDVIDTLIGYIPESCIEINNVPTPNIYVGHTIEQPTISINGIDELLSILNVNRFDNYEDWMRIGMILKGLGDYVDLYNKYSKQSKKYTSIIDIETKWLSYKKNRELTIGTLLMMAKTDNCIKYKQWIDKYGLLYKKDKYIKNQLIEIKEQTKQAIHNDKEKAKQAIYNAKEKVKQENNNTKEEAKKALKEALEQAKQAKYTEQEESKQRIIDEYQNYKKIFETQNSLFMLCDPLSYYFKNDGDTEPICYTYKQMEQLLQPYKCGDKYFFTLWLSDTNRKTYNRIDFLPNNTNDKIYNMFRGFKYDNNKPINETKLNSILQFVNRMFNKDNIYVNHFLDWVAWIRQRPDKKTEKFVLLYSETHGVGKNTLIEFVKKIIGYTGIINSLDDLTKNFNANLAYKLLIVGDELRAKDRNSRDYLKNVITRTTMNLEKKGVDAVKINDLANYIGSTNNYNSVFTEQGDRRYSMYNVIEQKMTDDECNVIYKVLDDIEALESFDTFLKNRKIPDKLPNVINKYKQSVMNNSIPSYIQMVYYGINKFADMRYTIDDIIESAIKYAKDNNLEWTFSKDKCAKDFKKEFESYFKKLKTHNEYKFPPRIELLEFLKSKRPELLEYTE